MQFHDFSVSEDNSNRYFDDFGQILFNFDQNFFFEKLFHSVAKNVFLWKIDTLGMSGRNIAGNIFLMKIFIFPEFPTKFLLGDAEFWNYFGVSYRKCASPNKNLVRNSGKNEKFHQKNISANITSAHPQSPKFSLKIIFGNTVNKVFTTNSTFQKKWTK